MAQISLPLFMTKRTKILFGILSAVVALPIYMIPNHHPFITPTLLPMNWIDLTVPFIPETVWIYSSEYLLFYSAYFVAKDNQNVNKYLYSFFFLQLVSSIIFIIFPTTFPRDLFPLVADGSLTYRFFSHLREVDAPTNCLPSLHVSSCYLTSFIFLDESKKKFRFYFIWASMVALSTLTTKQHYLIDVITGLGMAYAFYWFFHKKIKYYQPNWWYMSSNLSK